MGNGLVYSILCVGNTVLQLQFDMYIIIPYYVQYSLSPRKKLAF